MRSPFPIYIALYVFAVFFYGCLNDDDDSAVLPQTEVTNVDTVGGSKNDSGQSVIATQDGGYAILGYTQSTDFDITDKQDESFDYWVLKFNSGNALQWQKTYGGTSDDRGRSIIQTQDGGYAVLGFSFSSDVDVTENAGQQDYWLAKLDGSGAIVWQKSFGFQGADSGISIIQTTDQGYLISGIMDVTASGGDGIFGRTSKRHAGGDYWVLKLDAAGNTIWSRYFGGNFTDTPEGIAQTDDGDYIIVGGSDSTDTDISNNIGSYDFWVIRVSATGELVWEKSYGGDQIDEARAVIGTDDGNFVIAGDTRSSNNDVSQNIGAADLWLIKISPEGDLIWEKTLGGTNFDVARAMVLAQDGGFLLGGSSRSSDVDIAENNGQNDAWVLKTDHAGNLQWETTIGGSNIDFGYGIAQLRNQSVILVGDSTSDDGDLIENKGFTDMLIVKIN